MKKFILMALLSATVLSANAQIATENSNALDNIGVGGTAGVSTPLDFNDVFPLNTNVGLKLTKDFMGSLVEFLNRQGDSSSEEEIQMYREALTEQLALN